MQRKKKDTIKKNQIRETKGKMESPGWNKLKKNLVK
jgi:hypothetical protein